MATKTLNRPDTFTLLRIMEEMRDHREELQKLKNHEIISSLKERLGSTVSGVTIAKFMKQLGYVKPPKPPKTKSDKILPRMGRIEVVVAELLVELEKDGVLPSARKLLEKLSLKVD